VVQGNYIGTDVTGSLNLGNANNGVLVETTGNTIGSSVAGAGNVISGNAGIGIDLVSNNNLVQGNHIGTDAAGTAALANTFAGIRISGTGNTVGGVTSTPGTGAGNVISGNTDYGVYLNSGSSNLVQGNLIGTNAAGTVALANGFAGVAIFASGNTVGGLTSTPGTGAGNVISGNTVYGVDLIAGGNLLQGNLIGTTAAGNAKLANGTGVAVGSTGNTIGGSTAGARNVLSGNANDGIDLFSGSNIVQGNYIGTNAAGTAALGNSFHGIYAGSANNTVGGATPGTGNVVSGNGSIGVWLNGTGNTLGGSYIGVNAAGTAAVANGSNGVYVTATGNTIGGVTSTPGTGAGNVISGNTNYGIAVAAGANLVQGNLIGTTADGTAKLANATGIALSSAGNTIGGTTAGTRNVISGNTNDGIDAWTGGNLVQGNYIGSNAAGSAALANNNYGVYLPSANNTIGGTTPAARNVISGNGFTGIGIYGSGTSGNIVQGNYLGADATGSQALPNSYDGVLLFGQASNNLIGGTAAGAGNTIVFNLGYGAEVDSGAGNAIEANVIYSNGQLGLRLNQASDANNNQAAPVLSSAVASGGSTTIQGTLHSTANGTFRVELFANTVPDPSGFGEGETFLGSTTLTTDASGNGVFTFVSGSLTGKSITATATNSGNDTSQFSADLLVSSLPMLTAPADQTANEGASTAFSLGSFSDADGAGGPWSVTIVWGDGSPNSTFSISVQGALAILNHAYPDNGSYTVSVSVTNSHGGSGSASFGVSVANVAPTAVITGAPASGPEGTVISLGSTVTDPSPVDTVAGLTGAWSVTKNGNAYASGSGASFAFTPDDDGTYVVTLTAPDKDGGTGTANATIAVTNVAPTAVITGLSPPLAAFIVSGQTLTFFGVFTDPGTLDKHTVTWNFGDGNSATTDYGASGSASFSAAHAYAAPGAYTVKLTVLDKDGGLSTAEMIVVVQTPSEATALVQSQVQSLTGLNSGEQNSLTTKLDAAIASLGDGNTAAATNQLRAFEKNVAALQRAGRLSAAQAALFTSLIDAILAAL
jgi:hypothetical protein